MIKFRPETLDLETFRLINEKNVYRLPKRFYEDEIVIDVGAHIGSFTFACLYRGVGKVVAFEPDEIHFALATEYLSEYRTRVELNKAAVWRSDGECDFFSSYHGAEDTVPADNESLLTVEHRLPPAVFHAIALDTILTKFDNVRLLKISSGGTEWPILLTCKRLDQVEEICGEYHETQSDLKPRPSIPIDDLSDLTAGDLECFLHQHFDDVCLSPKPTCDSGFFWAKKFPHRYRYRGSTTSANLSPMTLAQNVPAYAFNAVPAAFGSCVCCSNHFRMPLYSHWCRAFGETPRFHRKQWEFVYICQSLYERNMLRSGITGIGFGVGREPLVALFASRGVKVLASDLPHQQALDSGWVSSSHRSEPKTLLNNRGLCRQDDFDRLVSYRDINMNEIPSDLGQYDFCWSACAFEHLGSIRKGIEFVLNSCKLLKPGGVAIHTTEFNLSSNTSTIDNNEGCVVYRRSDIELLRFELRKLGYILDTVDYFNGEGLVDKYVDSPPYLSEPHLRLLVESYTCTSLGLIILNSSV